MIILCGSRLCPLGLVLYSKNHYSFFIKDSMYFQLNISCLCNLKVHSFFEIPLSLFFSSYCQYFNWFLILEKPVVLSCIYLGFSLLENRVLWRWGYPWKIYNLSSTETTEGIHNPMSNLSKSSLCKWTYQGFNPSKALTKGYLDTKLTFSQEPLFPETEEQFNS